MIKTTRNSMLSALLTCLAWIGTWSLTQGFYMSTYLQNLVPGSLDTRIAIITTCTFIVAIVAILILQKEAKKIFTRSRWLWLYLLPLACIIALQFTYEGPLHLWVFIAMIVLSVFWQDTLTFGLFQGYLRKVTSQSFTILIVGTLFGFGHVLAFAPDMAQLLNPGFYLLFIVGYLFAWLRERMGNIYVINVIHMTFLLAAMIKL